MSAPAVAPAETWPVVTVEKWVDQETGQHMRRLSDKTVEPYDPLTETGDPETNEPAARPNRPPLVIRPIAEVAAEVDARALPQFLFEGVWAEGDYGVISAEDKAGKTWADLDAAVSVAGGTPWLGVFRVPAAGPVVLFLGEGGDRKILRRLRAIATARGLSADQLPIHLCFRTPDLSAREHLEQMADYIAQVRPRLVIVDPLYLAARGANGADLYAMAIPLQDVQIVCQDAAAALIITHHWNKTGPTRPGAGNVHARSSGVGPGAWGRVLVAIAVDDKLSTTDPITGATAVRQTWSFRGDEIFDQHITVVRHVVADDPKDLTSALHYRVELVDVEQEAATAEPAQRAQILTLLEARPYELTKNELVETIGGNAKTARNLLDAMHQAGDLHVQDLKRTESYGPTTRQMTRALWATTRNTVPLPGPGTDGPATTEGESAGQSA